MALPRCSCCQETVGSACRCSGAVMGGHLHGWQAGPSARPEASLRTCPCEGLSVDNTLSSCVRAGLCPE